jgi:hypothetical protein
VDARDVLAQSIASTKALMERYLAGFTDDTRAQVAPGLPNHAAWSLGHCALTMHRLAERVDGLPLPSADFGDGPGKFVADAVAFGSAPAADADAFPSLERCVEVYRGACDRLAAAVRSGRDEQILQIVKWGSAEFPWWLLVSRMVFHNGFHTGQIADLRRAFRFKSVFA